jgi:23S rRNA pseudouridine2605 synthase
MERQPMARTRPRTSKTGTTPESGAPVRLHKFLAAAGVASRREAERLIQGGRVEVNGQVVTTPGTRADPARDTIKVDGRRVHAEGARAYYLLHKPRGYITSVSDPEGRPTVMGLLHRVRERVFPVGRLDWNSEGLLLFTNDGDLAYHLTHPSNHVPKVSRVKVKGIIAQPEIERARRGLFLDGRKSLPARVTRISSQANTWLEVALHEGRKNQIRRIFERLGHPVLKLRRISIGPIADRNLKPGQFRRLTDDEVRQLKEPA